MDFGDTTLQNTTLLTSQAVDTSEPPLAGSFQPVPGLIPSAATAWSLQVPQVATRDWPHAPMAGTETETGASVWKSMMKDIREP